MPCHDFTLLFTELLNAAMLPLDAAAAFDAAAAAMPRCATPLTLILRLRLAAMPMLMIFTLRAPMPYAYMPYYAGVDTCLMSFCSYD